MAQASIQTSQSSSSTKMTFWAIGAALVIVGLVILAMNSFKAGVSLDTPVQKQVETKSMTAPQLGPAESNGVSNMGTESTAPTK